MNINRGLLCVSGRETDRTFSIDLVSTWAVKKHYTHETTSMKAVERQRL